MARAWPTPGAFDDVRILEIGDESVDFCGMLLAGQGADVLKIEPPEGSPSRRIGPFYQDDPGKDRSLYFWTYNRGKRSVTLDLSSAAGKKHYLELAATAQVVLDAQGLGAMDALGLGYDEISRLNPGLVYCSITPFGLTGPWRHFKGSDLVHQALGGPAFCIGYDQVSPGKWDTPPLMPQAWHSYGAVGEHAAVAIAGALIHRQATGAGQLIDASIHDACAQITEATVTRYIYYGRNHVRNRPQHLLCSGGRYLALVLQLLHQCNVPKLRKMLLDAGFGEALQDAQFDQPAYVRSGPPKDALIAALRAWAATQTVEQAFAACQGCALVCAPVRPPEDLIDDPQCRQREDFVEIEHPELGRSFTYPRHPNRQSATPWRWGPRAPLLGEHTSELLASSGKVA